MVNTDSRNTDIHIGEIMLNSITKATKGFFNWMLDFFDSMARAQAAAELTRNGHHEAAKRLMLKETD
jgi:hypothetical protein